MTFITNSLLKCQCSHDTSGAASESHRYSTLLVSVAHDRQYNHSAPCEEKSGKQMVSCHRVNSLPS